MSGNLRLYNSSGYVELQAPSDATSQVLELPTDSIKPGLVLLAQESFTAQSAVSVDSVFSAEYDNYRVLVTGVASATTTLVARYRAAGTDEASSGVYSRGFLWVSSGGTGFEAGSAASTVCMFGNLYTTGRFNIASDVYAPHLASTETNNHFSSTANTYFAGWNRCTVTTQFDGITFFPNSGTITGSLSIYGYRNS